MHEDPDPILSVTEVAERLRRTSGQVLDLIEQGELRYAPTTDRATIRIPESAVVEFLTHHEGGGTGDGARSPDGATASRQTSDGTDIGGRRGPGRPTHT